MTNDPIQSAQAEIERMVRSRKNVALSLSGGKDSLACFLLAKPYMDQITIYWCNTGDAFPETVEFMSRIRSIVPRFVEVPGRKQEVEALDGWASDVVPQRYTSLGNMVHGKTEFRVQERIACCYQSLMYPMYERMIADGIDGIIRGKRSEEEDRTGLESGHVGPNGEELVFPILNWTGQEVRDFIESQGVELPRFYKHGDHSIDCMLCTAFWSDGHAKYLKNEHPVVFDEYARRIGKIKRAIADELSHCEI